MEQKQTGKCGRSLESVENYSKRKLIRPDEPHIKWNHFKTLYDIDIELSEVRARVCPKLSKNHIKLININFAKMGPTCYTIVQQICSSRKHSFQGVSPDTKDFKMLQLSFLWLNNWEMNMRNNLISPDEFLTANTAEGLRVTLKSTLDLCEYLTTRCDFSYILTGKLNQDVLEKFFWYN